MIGHQHHEAVDADAPACRWRQPVLQGPDEGSILDVVDVVETVVDAALVREHGALLSRVVELGVGVDDLVAVGIKFESF